MDTRNHLLIVDDDRSVCDLLTVYFEHKGYQVSAVESDAAARDLFEEFRFDAAVIDWTLGGMLGLDLILAINARHPQTPVIIFTGVHDLKERFGPALAGHAAAIVRKNGSLDSLAREISRLLSKNPP